MEGWAPKVVELLGIAISALLLPTPLLAASAFRGSYSSPRLLILYIKNLVGADHCMGMYSTYWTEQTALTKG